MIYLKCVFRDGIPDIIDNCPRAANPNQLDTDKDGEGDACDSDIDGDGLINERDNCALAPNPRQEDEDGTKYLKFVYKCNTCFSRRW